MSFPTLRHWTLPEKPIIPTKRINNDPDLALWKTSQGYLDYGLFVRRLNQSVIGHFLPYTPTSTTEAVKKTVDFLDVLLKWVDEIPPHETAQRFGNTAFRDWGKRLEERATSLLEGLLPADLHPAIPQVQPYLLQSFGSFGRIDYGTGHELAFAMFLCGLEMLRFFDATEEDERQLGLIVFPKYLEVVWKLQDVYKLEPAGSHGVWGLDDYCFLPYVLGSGELQEHLTSRPPDILKAPLPPTNLYHLAINRIHALKTGPFNEHSPQLHSIASSVPTWWKVNQGLFKMYEAEVLGKRVVVQHLPLGGIFEWVPEDDDDFVDETPAPLQPSPNLLAAPSNDVLHGSPQSLHEPLPNAPGTPSPNRSPLLGGGKHLAGGPASPIRQGTLPRPKGGRLAAALSAANATSPSSPSSALPSTNAEPNKVSTPAKMVPIVETPTPANRRRSSVGLVPNHSEEGVHQESPDEPALQKAPELEAPTSPQNVAKILSTNPVDHRTFASIPEPTVTPAVKPDASAPVDSAAAEITPTGAPKPAAGETQGAASKVSTQKPRDKLPCGSCIIC